MMIRVLLLSLCSLLTSVAFGQTEFEKAYYISPSEGLTTGYYPGNTLRLNDGSYILAGSRGITIEGGNTFVLKIDSAGNPIWSRSYYDCSHAAGITEADKGGFLILGTVLRSSTTWAYDLMLVRIDSMGDTLWTRSLGNNSWSSFDSYGAANIVKQGPNSYYIAGGTNATGTWSAMILNVDSTGTPIWWKIYGAAQFQTEISKIRLRPNGNVAFAGNTTGSGGNNVLLGEVDPQGNLLWSKTIGMTYNQRARDFQLAADGSFLITGETTDTVSFYEDMFFLKADSAGNFLWGYDYGGTETERGYGIIETQNTDIVALGYFEDTATTLTNMVMIRADSSGAIQSTWEFGTNHYTSGSSLVENPDGSITAAGTILLNLGQFNGFYNYVVRTDITGVTGCRIAPLVSPTAITWTTQTTSLTVTNHSGVSGNHALMVLDTFVDSTMCLGTSVSGLPIEDFVVYPNPADEELFIRMAGRSRIQSVAVIDATGRIVLRDAITDDGRIDLSSIPAGLYVIRLDSGNSVLTKKILVR